MDEDRQKFSESAARAIDSVNRLMLFVALLVFYFLITPILYKIEKSARTTTIQVESLNKEVRTLEQRIIERMQRPEKWQLLQNQMKTLLTPASN